MRNAGRCRRKGRALLARVTLLLVLAVACRERVREEPPGLSIRVGVPYDLGTSDPHASNMVSDFSILGNVYESLTSLSPGLQVEPCLATSWESPDALTWIFHLRPGVTFHSGKPLRAADVVYSLRRVLRNPSLEMRLYVVEVSSADELDPLTVRVRTSRPTRILLNKLSFVVIVPEGSTDLTLDAAPDGTGPYRLARWERHRRLTLERNEKHWRALPAIRSSEFQLGLSPDEASRALLAGELQLIGCNDRTAEARIAASPKHHLVVGDDLNVKFVGFDVTRRTTPWTSAPENPFRNRLVRQAIHLGIDRTALVAALARRAVPVSQLVPQAVFGFDGKLPPPRHDPERARALLAEAGLAGGFSMTLHVGSNRTSAPILAEQLAKIGIDVEVRELPFLEFLERGGNRGFGSWFVGSGCPTGDSTQFFEGTLHSRDHEGGLGLHNWGGHSDPALDRDIVACGAIEVTAARQRAEQAIMRRAMEELIVIPLYVEQNVFAMESSLDFEPRSDGYLRLATVTTRRTAR